MAYASCDGKPNVVVLLQQRVHRFDTGGAERVGRLKLTFDVDVRQEIRTGDAGNVTQRVDGTAEHKASM